jgi:hypothetical protein
MCSFSHQSKPARNKLNPGQAAAGTLSQEVPKLLESLRRSEELDCLRDKLARSSGSEFFTPVSRSNTGDLQRLAPRPVFIPAFLVRTVIMPAKLLSS